jgi:hypothetical protein
MDKKIKISCKGSREIPWQKLTPLQGNLKDLTKENFQKLKNEIIQEGFTDPINAWMDENGVWWILDGHQRLRVVKVMVEEEGWICPPLPVAEVFANTLAEAKKKLLGLASQYGEVTSEGLFEFAQAAKIDLEELAGRYALPGIDFPEFAAEHYVDIPSHLKEGLSSKPVIDPEIEFSAELDEKTDYIILLFSSKEKWKSACEKLGVKSAQFNLSPSGNEGFLTKGIGRLINGEAIFEKL